MDYPKLYLAIDNCFASKRWTEPDDWARVIKNLGISYVEASADNECDPLYSGSEYLCDWARLVSDLPKKHRLKVANLYSGHGTYATLGLAHTDKRIRDRMQYDWLMPMMNIASEADCGIGFFCHAFSQAVLQDSSKYEQSKDDLYKRLSELSSYWSTKSRYNMISVEQMYTPHQIPWTVNGSLEMIKEIYAKENKPCYITIDTGHQSGQHKYLPLSKELILTSFDKESSDNIWMYAPASSLSDFYHNIVNNVNDGKKTASDGADEILQIQKEYPYLFSQPQDSDTYHWLRILGGYSPIIHLQQTNGKSSSHLAFDSTSNETGIIKADKILKALLDCYNAPKDSLMPPMCDKIYLTLEMFFSTSEYPSVILDKMQKSVDYFRKAIPDDGIYLNEAVKLLTK